MFNTFCIKGIRGITLILVSIPGPLIQSTQMIYLTRYKYKINRIFTYSISKIILYYFTSSNIIQVLSFYSVRLLMIRELRFFKFSLFLTHSCTNPSRMFLRGNNVFDISFLSTYIFYTNKLKFQSHNIFLNKPQTSPFDPLSSPDSHGYIMLLKVNFNEQICF